METYGALLPFGVFWADPMCVCDCVQRSSERGPGERRKKVREAG